MYYNANMSFFSPKQQDRRLTHDGNRIGGVYFGIPEC